ncbi:MAG: family 20 glycosylhydrolase, partial [Chitinophagaceae bacterium]|nr:family 20 glycosylhydrolase [Chitinophagaceae bacterium]
KYIDYLALHKMNYFHWHLTDDQGWRIEIKKYPRLTQIGGFRNGTIIGRYPGTGNDEQRYGGYYTQDEIREIVAYAAQRFITVVPEIELPGHASAAIAAYPILSCFPSESTQHPADCAWAGDTTGKQVQQTWGVFDDVFCAGKETTFEFLQDVMDEVMELFPGKLLHVGGDECPKSNWKRCPQCQQRMRDNNLKDEHELQSYFIQRMEKYLNGKGRSIIGWDEILEGGLAPNAAVMSWRGEEGGITAAKQKHNVVMTPGGWMYFDHTQSEQEDSVTIGGFTTIQKVYSYEPIPTALTADEGKYILGAQANLWTEYIKNPRKVEYMVFPRMSALSEVQWSSKENRNWDSFEKRLQTQFRRYDLWKANYSKAYFDLQATVQPAADHKGLTWKLATKQAGAKISYQIQKSGQAPAKAWSTYKAPIAVQQSLTITARSIAPNGTVGNAVVQEFKFNKATGKPVQLTHQPGRSYPGDGAFTLVNGIQNTKGLARSKEFLGFEGDDCEALIDLGNATEVKEVIAHILEQNGSWIYRPQSITVWLSDDGSQYREAGTASMFIQVTPLKTVGVSFAPQKARYVKVLIKNHGLIGDGQAGAGHKAWLFVDELEVN